MFDEEGTQKDTVIFMGDSMTAVDTLTAMAGYYNYFGRINTTKYVSNGSIVACTYGLDKTRIGIVKDHAVYDANGNAILTCGDCTAGENIYSFGICCSPSLPKDIEIVTITRGAAYVQPNVTGPKCMLALSTKWLQSNNPHTHIWLDTTGKYDEVLLQSAKLPCAYGQGIITIEDVNNAASGTGNAPLNDYKTVGSSDIIGVKASKDYITLAQVTKFKFDISRQSYINKLASYTAKDFQGVNVNPSAYLKLMQEHLDYLNNGFKTIYDNDIIANFNYYLEKYGIGKHEEAVLMFMAVTAEESGYGTRLAENWGSTIGYAYNQRGGGYSQLTGITGTASSDKRIDFLEKVGYSSKEIANIVDIAFHLGTYLPFSSACYAWTQGNAIGIDITTSVIEYGMSIGADLKLIFLAVCYAINGGYNKVTIKNLINKKTFTEPSRQPNNWLDRKLAFNNAINCFPHGKSTYLPF